MLSDLLGFAIDTTGSMGSVIAGVRNAAIGIVEITRAASRIGAQTYEPLVPFLVATLIYATLIVLYLPDAEEAQP